VGIVKELVEIWPNEVCDRCLIKTTCSRARWLEIAASLYGLAKDSRAIHCLEKNPWSRIRRVGSGSQVIGRGAVSLFHSYYLWEFVSFLCFFSFVVLLLCNPNKILLGTERKKTFPPIISPFVTLELKGYLSDLRISFVSALWKLYQLPSKGDSSSMDSGIHLR